MLKSMILILTSVSLGVCGQLAIKLGINRAGDLQALMGHSFWRFVSTIIGSPLIMSGLVLYGISTIFWFLVLSRVELSLAYPMLSLGYIGILFVSSIFLGEKVTILRWSGTVFIILGVILTASTRQDTLISRGHSPPRARSVSAVSRRRVSSSRICRISANCCCIDAAIL